MTGPQQILIVEDEPLIAMMLEDFLEVLDKQACGTADNVASALERVEQGGIDAAIHDLNLRGGERSIPVAEALAARGVPFIFATGGSDDALDARFSDRPRLTKPFTMDSVQKALASL